MTAAFRTVLGTGTTVGIEVPAEEMAKLGLTLRARSRPTPSPIYA